MRCNRCIKQSHSDVGAHVGNACQSRACNAIRTARPARIAPLISLQRPIHRALARALQRGGVPARQDASRRPQQARSAACASLLNLQNASFSARFRWFRRNQPAHRSALLRRKICRRSTSWAQRLRVLRDSPPPTIAPACPTCDWPTRKPRAQRLAPRDGRALYRPQHRRG